MGERTTITTKDGTFSAYVTRPARAPIDVQATMRGMWGTR